MELRINRPQDFRSTGKLAATTRAAEWHLTPELSRAAVTPGAARQRFGVGLNDLLAGMPATEKEKMIRRFCDICDNELTTENTITGEKSRLTSEVHPKAGGPLMFEVQTGRNGTWNAGDFCKYCVIDAVNKLDDRPRAYPG